MLRPSSPQFVFDGFGSGQPISNLIQVVAFEFASDFCMTVPMNLLVLQQIAGKTVMTIALLFILLKVEL